MKGNIEAPITRVVKGWGHEEIYWNNEEYCGKKLAMIGGKKLSWHVHYLKDETFFVQSGQVKLSYGDSDDLGQAETIVLNPGSTFHVYRGLRHRLEALADSEIFEFSTHHLESDSVRIQKGD